MRRPSYGLASGLKAYAEAVDNGLVLRRPVTTLARVYVEPTNACNLDCRACVRRVWDEPLGVMEMRIFQRAVEAVKDSDPRPEPAPN